MKKILKYKIIFCSSLNYEVIDIYTYAFVRKRGSNIGDKTDNLINSLQTETKFFLFVHLGFIQNS